MATTVQTILDAAKYDLRDFGARDFGSTELIHYLNRCILLLDRVLISMNSDQTLTESTVTLSSGDNSVSVPTTYTVNIRQLWNSDEEPLYKMGPMELYERRMAREGDTAEPNYWSHIQNNIEFEVEADDDYVFTVYHDRTSTVLTATTDDMPYANVYDDYLREVMVMMARSKVDKQLLQSDAVYSQTFKSIVHQDMVNRNFVPKVLLDF